MLIALDIERRRGVGNGKVTGERGDHILVLEHGNGEGSADERIHGAIATFREQRILEHVRDEPRPPASAIRVPRSNV